MSERLPELVRLRIRALRLRRGLTQEALCERAGISLDAVCRIEAGSRVPTIETLDKIAEALGVSLGSLVGTEPPPKARPAHVAQRVAAILQSQPAHVQSAVEVVVRAMLRVASRSERKNRGARAKRARA